MKTACFIGHREIEITEQLEQRVKELVIDLVQNNDVKRFLFGSNSQFDTLCHSIVSELQSTMFFDITRVVYTCRSEAALMKEDKERVEALYSRALHKEVHLRDFDEEVEFEDKYTAGKASYVERNCAMIDDSDYCVFYYDESYAPPRRKYAKRCVFDYQPNSGTQLAFSYANSKKKVIFNTK